MKIKIAYTIIIILIVLIATPIQNAFAQRFTDKYLHYVKEYYYDSTLFITERTCSYELSNKQLYQQHIPITTYETKLLIIDIDTIETIEVANNIEWKTNKYTYIISENIIQLSYISPITSEIIISPYFPLNSYDTINPVTDLNSIDNTSGPSASGYTVYCGTETLNINDTIFNTYHFKKYDNYFLTGKYYFVEDFYLEQSSCIPIQSFVTQFKKSDHKPHLFLAKTILFNSSNLLNEESYTNNKKIIYEYKNKNWTIKQQQKFLSLFSTKEQEYAQCLLNKLNGTISFYKFDYNREFRLAVSYSCK